MISLLKRWVNNMKDLLLVASYTFQDLIKRKSFLISNMIILIIMIIGFNVPNIIHGIKGNDESFGKAKLAIIDQDNVYEGTLENLTQREEEIGYIIEIPEAMTVEEAKEKINQEEIDEAVFITREENTIHINYLVKSLGMMREVPQNLITILQESYKNLQIAKFNITQEQLMVLNMPFDMEVNQAEEKEVGGNILAMMLLSIVLFYAIYFYAYQVSTSITTEKTSKIIETLVTSTSPRTIVLGKTLGIGLVGVLQTIVLVVVAIICANLFLTSEMVSAVLDMSNMTGMLAMITIVYYILGYSLFALLYALTGSTVAKPEDIQSANGPVAILAVIGFYLSYFTMMNPTSSLNNFAAIFPISSPFCMPFRVMMGIATMPEILISLAVLLVTIAIVAQVSIKIYSSAILNYGSRINLKDMIKMYKNKND